MISMFSKAHYQDRWKGGSVQRTRTKALFRHHRHRRAQQGGAGNHKLCTITNKPMPSVCSGFFLQTLACVVGILIFGTPVLYNTMCFMTLFIHII